MNIGWTQVAREIHGQQQGSKLWSMSGSGWMWLLCIIVAIFLSKIFFMQVITGGVSMVWSEGNRLEVRRIIAARGVIEGRGGEILARNSVAGVDNFFREYPENDLFVHALGVVGRISEDELQKCGDASCDANMIIGKNGLEKYYQEVLSGVDGEEIVEVDAKGEAQRSVAKRDAVAGKTVRTNLDVGLGREIMKILSERETEKKTRIKAAVVVSKVDTGQVLALVSWPAYNNNVFNGGDKEALSSLLSDEEYKPMFNRVSGGAYPPGSVFKLVTLMAGLETGVIDRDTRVMDTGEIKIGQYRYGSWNFDQNGRTEGEMDVVKGLARSNDIFFYKVGEWLGEERLISWSRKMGLGEKTELDISGELAGAVPDPLERERRSGERWFLGNTYHLSIGQGDLLATPLQINRVTAGVISGKKCQFMIVGQGGECSDLNTGVENRKLILEGMKAVCRSGGTAFEFFDSTTQVACKTGTAQQGGEKAMPHAWISVLIPSLGKGDEIEAYEQGLVVTVLVEEAGEGSYEAAPIARKILDYVVNL
ncbi:hypothetical protein A2368_01305 [Candidatus Collierbacteria bacterium RIFOXYB1_FULL_49_13]|uniref:Penicillin-binding protein 2 n=1 Tax=Candidatus Collierbacteria bacterium RIFOXYB1_FULL_49_13 TaxID=1817728 RepID=A0A1F5FIF8_9BACT|nr:MAG: hypothetical protein A2368_01305 [Candidatus Collierbacteria bacterium RIFOXYB1_FULL_49_13]